MVMRTVTAAAPRTAMGRHLTRTPTAAARRTPTGRAPATATSTAAAPRTATMEVRATPTPMVEPHRGLTGMARHIPRHTERQPTPLRIIHPPLTMGTIRPPRWATTEQGATTAAPGRLRALPLWALWSAWPSARPRPRPTPAPPLAMPTVRATPPARPTPALLTPTPLLPTRMRRPPTPMPPLPMRMWPPLTPTSRMRWARFTGRYQPVASRPASREVEPTICAATRGSARPTARTGCTTAWCPLRKGECIVRIEKVFSREFRRRLRRVLMNRNFAITFGKQSVTRTLVPISKRLMILGALALAATVPVIAQNSDLQEKLAFVKQAIAENTQKLHQYQWIETTQLTLKGDQKPPSQNLCQYGPDGQVQKTAIGPPPEQPSGGRIRERIIERKKEEMQEYMQEVKGVLSMYVPPDPQKMQQAYQAGKASLNPAGGLVNLVFTDYAQPGDQMALTFDTAAGRVASVNVNTYMGEMKDKVTLQVQMASLPDGTNYVQQTVLDATAKKLQVTTTNSNYQKLGGY